MRTVIGILMAIHFGLILAVFIRRRISEKHATFDDAEVWLSNQLYNAGISDGGIERALQDLYAQYRAALKKIQDSGGNKKINPMKIARQMIKYH